MGREMGEREGGKKMGVREGDARRERVKCHRLNKRSARNHETKTQVLSEIAKIKLAVSTRALNR
eukprot:415157-Rhodomonas_salina.2